MSVLSNRINGDRNGINHMNFWTLLLFGDMIVFVSRNFHWSPLEINAVRMVSGAIRKASKPILTGLIKYFSFLPAIMIFMKAEVTFMGLVYGGVFP